MSIHEIGGVGSTKKPATVEQLQSLLLSAVEARLRDCLKLRYASLDAVLLLVRKQLQKSQHLTAQLQTEFADIPEDPDAFKEWLNARAKDISQQVLKELYVSDCEYVAEYRSASCTPERKREIEDYYWLRTQSWIERTAHARLLYRFRDRLDKHHVVDLYCTTVIDHAENAVFRGSGFAACARAYDPAKGKTFDRFLKTTILRRFLDAIRKLENPPQEDEFMQTSISSETTCSAGEPAERADNLTETITHILRSLPSEARMAWELYLKAYLDTNDMFRETIERLSQDDLRRIHQEYVKAACAWKKLSEEELPEAKSHFDEAQALEEGARRALLEDEWGGSREAKENLIDDLGVKALALTHEQLDEQEHITKEKAALLLSQRELACSEEGGCHGKVAIAARAKGLAFTIKELAYMHAFKRRKAAQNRLEALRIERAKYLSFRKHSQWVRTEAEIGGRMGFSQSTAHRRLEEGRDILRGGGDGFPGDEE